MSQTDELPFVPVVLGGDIGAYALGREFHEAYGLTSTCVIANPLAVVGRSSIFEHEYAESSDPDVVLAAVERVSARHPGKTIVLVTNAEAFIEAVHHVCATMPNVVAPTPSAEVVAQVSHKDRFNELCRAHGLDVPATEVVHLAGTDAIAPCALPFPAVAKPAYSPEYMSYIVGGFKKVYYVERQSELDELWAALRAAGFAGDFLVQELVGGDDTYMDSITMYVDSAGVPTLLAGANVLLEDHSPAALGNPVAMITTPMDETWERCAAMLSDIGYRGFANFDVKREPRDGRAMFLEVNPRIGRNSYYVCAGGVNPMRVCVEDLVYGHRLECAKVTDEILYTLLPLPLVRHYVRDEALLARLNGLIRQGRVYDPQKYPADKGLRRRVLVELTELNQYRKFHRYYPEATDTSF